MKYILLPLCLMISATLGFSQATEAEKKIQTITKDSTDGWDKGGTFALNFSQVSLANWAAGGQSSMSGNGLTSLFARYKKGDIMWENYLDVAYGSIKQGKNASWLKTDDKIDFTSKFGKSVVPNWYYAVLVNFKTQMAPGFNNPNDGTKISDLLAPGYFLGAIGMDFKPSKNFTAYIAPLTAKVTVVNDQELADAGAFGVEKATYDDQGNILTEGLNARAEFGGYVRFFGKRDIMKNVSLQTKLDLFSNYRENPGNIDVNWEVLVSMKVNKYISATISTNLVYDDDIDIGIDTNEDGANDTFGPRTQFKEVFGIGFSYKF